MYVTVAKLPCVSCEPAPNGHPLGGRVLKPTAMRYGKRYRRGLQPRRQLAGYLNPRGWSTWRWKPAATPTIRATATYKERRAGGNLRRTRDQVHRPERG